MKTASSVPARYFPLEKPLYEVAPGLRPFGFDFGNGVLDQTLFQIEEDFPRFRECKVRGRLENRDKYFRLHELPSEVRAKTVRFITNRLASESPALFSLIETRSGPDIYELHSHLTLEKLGFDENGQLLSYEGPLQPPPVDLLEALGYLVPEDFSLLVRRDRRDWLAALHLFAPSHWAAEDKIGKSFAEVHAPIPGNERLLKSADQLVEAMIHKGPYVRFVWSFVTDQRLNHHPFAPPDWDPQTWKGRSFDAHQANPFSLRIERQITWGLPEVQASLFTIKLSFLSGLEIRDDPGKRHLLLGALKSMSPGARRYKGVETCFDELTAWLRKEGPGI